MNFLNISRQRNILCHSSHALLQHANVITIL